MHAWPWQYRCIDRRDQRRIYIESHNFVIYGLFRRPEECNYSDLIRMENIEGFSFNDEFFLTDRDRKNLEIIYPKTEFSIYSSHISDAFLAIDRSVKGQKKLLQNIGFLTVTFALLALITATVEPTIFAQLAHDGHIDEKIPKAMAVIASIFGIISVLVGVFGLGFSTFRDRWLAGRLIAERIRQWRWQYFCAHLNEIYAAAQDIGPAKDEYQKRMNAAFDLALAEFKLNFRFHYDQICCESDAPAWIDPTWEQDLKQNAQLLIDSNQDPILRELRQAYLDIRIGAQERYAIYISTGEGPFRTHPRTQLNIIRGWSYAIIVAVFVVHALVLVGAWREIPALISPEVHALAVSAALCALALRALEDGLRPTEAMTRMRGYLAEIRALRRKFQAATTSAEMKDVISSMEDASFREMQDFLIEARAARFAF